jgi:hypothetical protein
MPGALFLNTPARAHINPTLPVVADLAEPGEPVIYCLPAEGEPLSGPPGAGVRFLDRPDAPVLVHVWKIPILVTYRVVI